MASAAPTFATSAYKVPDWAVKNKEIFLSCQKGAPPPTKERMPLPAWSAAPAPIDAAMCMAVLAEEVRGGIFPPTIPPGSNYFRDVANHPDVLSTIISTARHTVGFVPQVTGSHLTAEEAKEFLQKFNDFIAELDRYSVFIDLLSGGTQTVQNNQIDCNAMLRVISGVVAFAMNVATSGTAFEDLSERIATLVRAAIDFVSEIGRTTSAGFEMVGLPASNVQGEINPSRNPSAAVTFTTTKLSRRVSGKSTSEDSFLSIGAFSYQLKSSVIIEFADYLAGARITGNRELADFINAPLNDATRK